MDNFDLKKYLAENKLTTNSRLNEEDGEGIELKPVGRDTGVNLNLKKVKKMAEAEGYEVEVSDGNLLNIKQIDIKVPEAGTLIVAKNGEVFGDDNWGMEIKSEDDIYFAIKIYIEDQNDLSEPKGSFGEPWDSDYFGNHIK